MKFLKKSLAVKIAIALMLVIAILLSVFVCNDVTTVLASSDNDSYVECQDITCLDGISECTDPNCTECSSTAICSDASCTDCYIYEETSAVTRLLSTDSIFTLEYSDEIEEILLMSISPCTSCYNGKTLCDVCDGTGKYECYKCDGTGWVDCSTCGGDGEVVCSSCGGDGKNTWTTCSTCGGDGVFASKTVTETCSICGGSGSPNDDGSGVCGACGGRGEVTKEYLGPFICSTCGGAGGSYSGDGNEYCKLCSGGYKTCSTCSGKGYYACTRSVCDDGWVTCTSCDNGWVTCPLCNGTLEIYTPDPAPTIYIDGTSYAGGTKTSPTVLYLTQDSEVNFTIPFEGGQVTLNDTVVTYNASSTSKEYSYSYYCNDGETLTVSIVSQNLEGVSGGTGAESYYYTLIIDKDYPELYVSYYQEGAWTNYWSGHNDYSDEAVLCIEAGETFKVTTDDTTADVKMELYGVLVDYTLGAEIVGVVDTSYTFIVTDIAGNQSCVNVMCGYQRPELYVDNILLDERTYYFADNTTISWESTQKGTVIITNLSTGQMHVKSSTTAGEYELTAEEGEEVTYLIETADFYREEVEYYKITIDKKYPEYNVQLLEINSSYYVSRYFQINGMYYANYENAEAAYVDYILNSSVITSYWNDVDVFAENLAEGEIVASGTYYKYYQNNVYICYFSLENLENMIKELFATKVSIEYYNGSKIAYSKLHEDMYSSEIEIDGVTAYLINSFSFSSLDAVSITIKNVETGEYLTYGYGANINTALDQSSSGLYEVTETDIVGNSTTYYIYYDNDIGSITANISNYNGLKENVELTADEMNGSVLYYENFQIASINDVDPDSMVKVVSSSGTTWYRLLDETMPTITADGTYVFTIYDRSGNSMTFTVVIGVTDVNVYFDDEYYDYGTEKSMASYFFATDTTVSWGNCPEGSVTITNMSTEEEQVFSSEEAGAFLLTAEDGAEITYKIVVENINQNTKKYYQITIDKKAPSYNEEQIVSSSTYHVSKYYSINGMYYANYENAESAYVEYAMETMVVESVWYNTEVFAEIIAEGEIVSSGTYYKYYSGGTYECYFSLDNLHLKLKELFSSYVTLGYYTGTSLSSSKMYEDMYLGTIEVNGVTAYLVTSYTFIASDSDVITVKNIATGEYIDFSYGTNINTIFSEYGTGLYEICETDSAGNISKFYIYYDNEMNSINVNISNYSGSNIDVTLNVEELNNSVLYYETFTITSLNDIDTQAMVKVVSSSGTTWYRLLDETMPVISEEGTYVFTVYDRSGNSMSFTVNIGTENVGVTFSKSTSSVGISVNELTLSTYEDIRIEYNGYEIMYDNKGIAVNAETLNYTFDYEGGYRVYVTLNGATYSYYYEFYKGSPTFSYTSGISASTAISNVILEYDTSKYVLEIYKNDVVYNFVESTSGDTATVNILYKYANNGEYTLILKHKYSTSTDTNYTSSFLMNVVLEPYLVGVDNYGSTTDSVYVSWYEEMEVTATISVDEGDFETYNEGEELEDVGDYVIEVITNNSRIYTFEFSIVEKDKPYSITVGSRTTSSVPTIHNSTVKFSQVDSEAMIGVILDGTKLGSYAWGDTLSEDGYYIVSIYCGDDTYHHYFTIDTTAPVGYLVGVENGEKTQDTVTFGWLEDNITVRIQKDGGSFESYEYGEEITESGSYTITMTDKASNSSSYTFEIDNQVDIAVSVENGLISSSIVWVDTWEDLTITLTRDSEEIEYSDTISLSGFYTLTAVDDYGNVFYTEFMIVTNEMSSFEYTLPENYEWTEMFTNLSYTDLDGRYISLTEEGQYVLTYKNTINGSESSVDVYIDTTPPTAETIGFANGGVAEGNVSVTWQEENVTSSISKNGITTLAYTSGEEISSEGDYIVTLSDMAGNTTVVTVSKLWKLNTAGKVALGVGGTTLAGVAFELLRRRRIRFK